MNWNRDQVSFSMIIKTTNWVSTNYFMIQKVLCPHICIYNHRNSLIIFTAWSWLTNVWWKTSCQSNKTTVYECFCCSVQCSVNTHHTVSMSTTRKWPAVSRDDEVGECLLGSESKLSTKSPVRAWKPVTGRNLCCNGPLHAYGACSKSYPEIIFHQKKG